MKSACKISGEERRASIIRAAKQVFVRKGFSATTTRELAAAAGVSEALLFKHFPSKETLYSAILKSSFENEGSKIAERLRSLKSSTSTLVFLVRDLVSHIVGGQPDEEGRSFFRLVVRSLMEEGEFSRIALQGGPSEYVRKVAECIEAAKAAGDLLETSIRPNLCGWFVHQLVTGIMIHSLPRESVIDYGVSRDDLVAQTIRFCLLGMGLKEAAVRRCLKELERASRGPTGRTDKAV
jgi:AcrR family transcriptional regulator